MSMSEEYQTAMLREELRSFRGELDREWSSIEGFLDWQRRDRRIDRAIQIGVTILHLGMIFALGLMVLELDHRVQRVEEKIQAIGGSW